MRRAAFALVVGAAACAPALRPLPPPPPGAAPEDSATLAARSRAASGKTQHEPSKDARSALVQEAMEAGQRCEEAAPASAPCDYALALALGVQAREHPTTAAKGLPAMVDLLQRANKSDPQQDHAGPARVLALVLVRAPGWPLGPGDPEAGLKAAQQAARLFPAYAPNQLALSEALLVAGDRTGSEAAARRGLEAARAAAAAGDEPDAGDWVRDAEALAAGKSPR
ncbi:MAG TPA: hypothetical protein VEJ89_15550 [Myxococcaceae bacterium]|nr:hypothetical protein [Myxococcaceae bacterium]